MLATGAPWRAAAAPAADEIHRRRRRAQALTWRERAWILLSDAGYALAAADQAAAVEALGQRLADAETLSPEERQRLSRQVALLRHKIATPLVDPDWDPARAGLPPAPAGRNGP